MTATERLNEFTEARLRHPDNRNLNLLNTSLAAWRRYHGFLLILRDRYQKTSAEFVSAMQPELEAMKSEPSGPRPVTQEEWEGMQRVAEIGQHLHLEIESFYVFANILLDRIASTFHFYFGGKPNWNHRQLMEHLEKICRGKQLVVVSAELLRRPAELSNHIVEYRNKRIEHVEEPRLSFGTLWDGSGKTKIAPGFLYPEPGEAETMQNPTGDLDEILQLLDNYIVAVLDFFDANSEKSILPRPKPKSPEVIPETH